MNLTNDKIMPSIRVIHLFKIIISHPKLTSGLCWSSTTPPLPCVSSDPKGIGLRIQHKAPTLRYLSEEAYGANGALEALVCFWLECKSRS